MARGDEKTIKLSGDTKDLQDSFAAVEESYARVAQAAEEHAKAVEATNAATSDSERKAAQEHEKATKRILDGEKKRSKALQDKNKALAAGNKSIQSAANNEKSLTKAQDEGSKASVSKAAALGVAAIAVGVLAKAMGSAVEIAREMIDGMLEQNKVSEDQRAALVNLKKMFEDFDKSQKEMKEGITLVVAEFAKFYRMLEPAAKMVKWVKDEIVLFTKQATLMAQLFGSMAINMESFESASRRLHKVNKDLRQESKDYTEDKKREALVLKNYEDRLKSMEAGEKKREEEKKKREADAKARQQAWVRRQEEIKKWHANNAQEARDRAQAEREANSALASERLDESAANRDLIREQELREQILQLTLDGRDYEAERLEILATSATDTERRLRLEILAKRELNTLTDEADEKETKLRDARLGSVSALSNLGATALRAAGLQRAALALVAAKEAGIYFSRGLASLGAYDFWGATQYFAASASAAIQGGVGLIGGGTSSAKSGSSGGTPASQAPSNLTSGGQGVQGGGATNVTYNLNVQSLDGRLSNQAARQINEAMGRGTRMQTGGRR
jgi:hypothetical protein